MTATGVVRGAISVPGPCVVRLSWSDADGRLLGRRRSRDLSYALTLAPGRYRLDVEDDRPLTDTRRHTASRIFVDVRAGEILDVPLLLTATAPLSGTVEVEGEPARYARVQVVHGDGERVDVRADAHGCFLAAGLRPGPLTVTAHDARRRWSGRPVHVTSQRTATGLRLDTPTAGLAVAVRRADGGPLGATYATFVNLDTDQRYRAPVRAGLCAADGLAPGAYALDVDPVVGSLGGRHLVGHAETEQVGSGQVVLAPGAVITGRVVDSGTGQGDLAAVVTLLDASGAEVERTRTDRGGRFTLGRGLPSSTELTVVVTGGPERRHVTRVAVAEVSVTAGERRHLGDIELERTCRAQWTPSQLAGATMRLPATRV